ncbi:uncharacterized protein MONBRDRAFT_31471 [Monosiga brevicollis MX1]|uniref:Histone deacetylase interacting domain-containing protein n=1 Tax=Monosiga brevicollis TaxID=81824 RepID=A9UTD9_MONBE|nr:uncharacterized protein MONBRDRAFT_31471 [Monosiga brevicollis MX1]EDQ91231.1 predicted protein [Monosiga brevicollis MX1]|eukprot:XP_001743653.1 hypothetical protein [Monosiga brevicollis MX1]
MHLSVLVSLGLPCARLMFCTREGRMDARAMPPPSLSLFTFHSNIPHQCLVFVISRTSASSVTQANAGSTKSPEHHTKPASARTPNEAAEPPAKKGPGAGVSPNPQPSQAASADSSQSTREHARPVPTGGEKSSSVSQSPVLSKPQPPSLTASSEKSELQQGAATRPSESTASEKPASPLRQTLSPNKRPTSPKDSTERPMTSSTSSAAITTKPEPASMSASTPTAAAGKQSGSPPRSGADVQGSPSTTTAAAATSATTKDSAVSSVNSTSKTQESGTKIADTAPPASAKPEHADAEPVVSGYALGAIRDGPQGLNEQPDPSKSEVQIAGDSGSTTATSVATSSSAAGSTKPQNKSVSKTMPVPALTPDDKATDAKGQASPPAAGFKSTGADALASKTARTSSPSASDNANDKPKSLLPETTLASLSESPSVNGKPPSSANASRHGGEGSSGLNKGPKKTTPRNDAPMRSNPDATSDDKLPKPKAKPSAAVPSADRVSKANNNDGPARANATSRGPRTNSGRASGSSRPSSKTAGNTGRGADATPRNARGSDNKAEVAPDTKANTARPQAGWSAKPESAATANQRLKVEDALSYLDKVKAQFGSKPQVYNQFLDIMKDFKSQQIDTPGVIKKVSELFEGNPDLIVGFNTFLPPGYKIEVPDREKPQQILVSQPGLPSVLHTTAGGRGLTAVKPEIEPTPTERAVAATPAAAANMAATEADGQPRKQLEFSHAIQYVNKIKNRFATQLGVYKNFLEILHTYQKEQKSINEVYSQVADLFANHKDLLDEFSQFLPEAVPAAQAHAERQRRQQREARRSRSRRASDGESRAKRAKPLPEQLSEHGLSTEELAYFDRIKKVLRPASVYDSFLKCLNMFSHEIISAQDLINLVEEFLSKHHDLFDWFKRFVGYSNASDEGAAMIELDLAKCDRLDQSYRLLPTTHQKLRCSGRRHLEPNIAKVLNDKYVSFPVWTSEDSSFVASKKNAHEEALFRCEDERFELDLILECNLATIRVLEMVMHELQLRPEDQRRTYSFNIKNLGGRSESIHRKAVSRIYGPRTDDVLQALRRDPYAHIPIVLQRLKQKQQEWRKVQRAWNESWRDVIEKNYLKSLDNKSSTFKRNDTSAIKAKIIRANFKDKREQARKALKELRSGADVDRSLYLPRELLDFSEDVRKYVNQIVLAAYNKVSKSGEQTRDNIAALLDDFVASYISGEFSVPSKQNRGEGASSGEPRKGVESIMTKVKFRGSTPANVFYCSSRWAVFWMQYNMLWTRVANIVKICRECEQALRDDPEGKRAHERPTAVFLALTLPSEYDRSALLDVFLELTTNVVEGNSDMQSYEDAMRDLFTTASYQLTTIDKLAHALYRQLETLMDHPSSALSGAFLRNLAGERFTLDGESANESTQTDYLTYVVHTLGDSNKTLYKTYHADGKICVEIIDLEPGPDGTTTTAGANWLNYIEKYMDFSHLDEDLLRQSVHKPFLNRNKRKAGYEQQANWEDRVVFDNKLECHFRLNAYKMFFVVRSGDLLFRHREIPPQSERQAPQSRVRKHNKFRGWIGSWLEKHTTQAERESCDNFLRGTTSKVATESSKCSYLFKGHNLGRP